MKRLVLWGVVALLAGGTLWAIWPDGQGEQGDLAGPGKQSGPQEDDGDDRQVDAGYVIEGGVRKPPGKQLAPGDQRQQATKPGKPGEGSLDYGQTPVVKPDASPQAKAVVAAVKAREDNPQEYSRAVSALAVSETFDRQRYETDAPYREQYLGSPGPARVFSPAQPGADVERIQPMSPLRQVVEQGQKLKLRVVSVAKMPVTFTSFDLGRFENQLTSITVEANEHGLAEVDFEATPGTIEDVHIMAASPVTSGQARFVVNVQLPEAQAQASSAPETE